MKIKTIAVLLFCFCCQFTFAQYQIGLIPRVSPDKKVYQKIGFTEVEITYGSPRVKDRIIWGGLEPYDQVWRAGANNATTIRFSEDVTIYGSALKKGTYALFIIPREKEKWTLIFSENEKQWGAFSYKESEDAMRIEIAPEEVKLQEELTYTIEGDAGSAIIEFRWEKIRLQFELKTNPLSNFQRMIEERVANVDEDIKWVVYVQGAEYLLKENASLDVALEWLNESGKLYTSNGEWNEQYYPKSYILGHLYWLKAQLYALEGNYSEAISSVDSLKSITGKINYYERKNEREGIDEKVENWEEKNK